MGEATRSWEEKPQGAVPRFELEDYILARMDLRGMSVREPQGAEHYQNRGDVRSRDDAKKTRGSGSVT